jgi:hypothetical protein
MRRPRIHSKYIAQWQTRARLEIPELPMSMTERHLTEYTRGLCVNYALRRTLCAAHPLSKARDNELRKVKRQDMR